MAALCIVDGIARNGYVLGWMKLRWAGKAAAVGEAHDHAQITPALRRELAVTIRRVAVRRNVADLSFWIAFAL